jgi:hypothetical protein
LFATEQRNVHASVVLIERHAGILSCFARMPSMGLAGLALSLPLVLSEAVLVGGRVFLVAFKLHHLSATRLLPLATARNGPTTGPRQDCPVHIGLAIFAFVSLH